MCNHIIGLLFRVENAVKSGVTKPTCTSQACAWKIPANKVVPDRPVVLSNQKWTKDQYDNQGTYITYAIYDVIYTTYKTA